MLTSKQRAKLRGMASTMDTIFQLGKGGIQENFIIQINDALRVRELIKIKVLENSGYDVKSAAIEIAEKTDLEVVNVIGTKIVLYKRNKKDPVIEI